jgi:hypothetical protein
MRVSRSLAIAASRAAKVVGAFRAAGAVSGSTARRLADLRLNQSSALSELIQSRAVRKAGTDRYFLDEAVWAQRRQLATSTVLRLAIALVLGLVAWLLIAGSR